MGWLSTLHGAVEAGLGNIRKALAEYRRMGWQINLQHYTFLLACAYWRAGQPELAMATLVDAFTSTECMHAHYYDAELYRLTFGTLCTSVRPVACT